MKINVKKICRILANIILILGCVYLILMLIIFCIAKATTDIYGKTDDILELLYKNSILPYSLLSIVKSALHIFILYIILLALSKILENQETLLNHFNIVTIQRPAPNPFTDINIGYTNTQTYAYQQPIAAVPPQQQNPQANFNTVMNTWVCPECYSQNLQSSEYCSKCGFKRFKPKAEESIENATTDTEPIIK